MSLRVSSTASNPSGLAQPRDGQRLAGSLRVCRLTTLYGVAGGGKTTLLQHDVLPMLHRRATDMAVPHGLAPRVVIPFADRRRGPGAFGGARSAEVAVLFDDWTGAPLPQLLAQIHDAMGIAAPAPSTARLSLAGSLAALNMQFGARFLVILDQFEDCLVAAEQSSAVREFLDQLVQSLNRPLLPVNFLIAVREESRDLLDGLRARVPGFDDQSLQLGAPPEARTPLRRVPASLSVAAPDTTTPPHAEPLDAAEAAAPRDRTPAGAEEDWLLALGAIVQRASVSARHEGAPDPGVETWPAVAPETPSTRPAAWPQASPESDDPAEAAAESAFAATSVPDEDEDDASPPPGVARAEVQAPAPASARVQSTTLSRKVEVAVWVTAGVLLVGYGAWLVVAPRGEPAELTSPVAFSPPVPATTVTPAPAAPVATMTARAPAGIDAAPRPFTELAMALALASPAATSDVAAVAWPAGFSPLPGAPKFAVARYDALQLARRQAATSPLQVLAPLYTEPVYFVARADSPMTYIHDIEGAAINAGPAESSRRVTAASTYQRLFDKPLPNRGVASSDADAALGQLLDRKGVDVLVLAGPQPGAWFANLPPATAQALKLLKLDPKHPADQRALQAYLPATLRAGPAGGTPSLAVMSFLVAADAADGVKALCASLPVLQQTGDPKWRELQPGLQLDAGWPASPAAQQAWRACAASRP